MRLGNQLLPFSANCASPLKFTPKRQSFGRHFEKLRRLGAAGLRASISGFGGGFGWQLVGVTSVICSAFGGSWSGALAGAGDPRRR